MKIDTGASVTVINPALQRSLGLTIDRSVECTTVGVLRTLPTTTMLITLDGDRVHAVQALVAVGAPLLLGMDVLQYYRMSFVPATYTRRDTIAQHH
jgi:predicted aspartyl protease